MKEIYVPANSGLSASSTFFPGFSNREDLSLPVGQGLWLTLGENDILSFTPGNFAVSAFDYETGAEALQNIIGGEEGKKFLSPSLIEEQDYNSHLITERLRGLGLSHEKIQFYHLHGLLDENIVWKAKKSTICLFVIPETSETLLLGQTQKKSLSISHIKNHNPNILRLPAPLGEINDEFTISKGTAQSYLVPKGTYIQIIDIEGRQCSDFTAFNQEALEQGKECYIDSAVSRTFTRGAYPRPGLLDKFFDNNITPLLALVQDTIGRHDTFALACTARGYEERGYPGHVNCSDNISKALETFGITPRKAWPAVNFFFNTQISPTDNLIVSDEAWSRPGDYVLMEALRDLVCVSTACPDDIDPINGWNPTDIHVRLYNGKRVIKPAISYRISPNEEGTMTTESPFHRRTSALTQQYHPNNDYWLPAFYEQDGMIGEYWATRDWASIQDMSSLRAIDIVGPDALPLLQKIMTKDIRRLSFNRGTYSLICDESGCVIDDGTVFHMGDNLYRWTCGTHESLPHLRFIAEQMKLRVWIRDMTKNITTLSIQGPQSRDILQPLLFTQPTQPRFETVKWFGSCVARLRGRTGPSMLVTRTGYTGELGYEIFCDNRDALEIWDDIMNSNPKLTPMGTAAQNILRIEAGLMAMGAEFGPGINAEEAGLGFAVDLRREDFIGATAIQRQRQAPSKKLIGLLLETGEVPKTGDPVYLGRRQIGEITSSVRSPSLLKTIAMARVAMEYVDVKNLEVGQLDGYAKRLPAEITDLPFLDAGRKKPRS